VVGTQCRNGYTAFQGKIIDEWIEEEGGWRKIVQVPVPSFAGKDKASTCINMKAAAHKRQDIFCQGESCSSVMPDISQSAHLGQTTRKHVSRSGVCQPLGSL
jgi:hypothetical protein